MKKEQFRQFQTIFKAGDKAGKVYLLVTGSVGIFLPDNDSKDPNFFIKENEIFGEMGVIDDELRMADARAMEESELVSVDRAEFEKMLGESNVFIRAVIGVLSDRLRQIQKPKNPVGRANAWPAGITENLRTLLAAFGGSHTWSAGLNLTGSCRSPDMGLDRVCCAFVSQPLVCRPDCRDQVRIVAQV